MGVDSTLTPERRAALAIAAAAIIVAATALILPATSFTVTTVSSQEEASQQPAAEELNYTELSPLQQQLVDEAIANESATVGGGERPLPRDFAVTKDGTTYVMEATASVEGQFTLFSTAIVLGAFALYMWATGVNREVGEENISKASQDKPWDYDFEEDRDDRNSDRRQ